MKLKALLLMASLFVSGNAFGAPMELNFISLQNGSQPTTKYTLDPWIEEIKQKTNGEIIIYRFDVNTLVPVKETYDSTVKGLVDIASNTCSDNPGRFPLNELLELPMLSYGAQTSARTIHDMGAKYPEWTAEFKDIHLLWQWASPSFDLHTSKKLVRTLEDIKGMKILVWNSTLMDVVAKLGGVPIMVSATDSYLSLSRGMAEGVVAPTPVLDAWKLMEVTKYHTRCDLSAASFWLGMNNDRWNSLSEEQKALFTETSKDMHNKCSEIQHTLGVKGGYDHAVALGHEVVFLEPQERERWMSMLDGYYTQWVQRMQKLGYKNAEAILNDAKAFARKNYEELVAEGKI